MNNKNDGACGTQYFQYYSLDNAVAVTQTGQVVTFWAANTINKYLNKLLKTTDVDYMIYGDTDSIMVDFSKVVENFANEDTKKDVTKVIEVLVAFSEAKIEPLLEQCFKELAEYLNSFSNNITMARDCVSSTGVFLAKKRYFMDVWNKEGEQLSQPELKITGIEVVRTSTPKVCRDSLKECVVKILREDEQSLQQFVKQAKKQFSTCSIEEIAESKSMGELSKYYDENENFIGQTKTVNSRASANYNRYLKELQLDKKYEKIVDGTKIKMCHLYVPNPVRDDIVAFISKMPKEFELQKYINYDKHFENYFIKPITSITSIIGWSPVKKRSLSV